MQVILKETLDHVGEAGAIVNVKDGYARNYLFPRNLAAPASAGMKRQIEHIKRLAEKKRQVEIRNAQDLKTRLEGLEVTIEAKAGEKHRLYGSVTTGHIAEALAKQGIDVDRRKIVLDHPIREVGGHKIRVKVDPKVSAEMKVIVVASADSDTHMYEAYSAPAPAVAEEVNADDVSGEEVAGE